MLIVAIMFVKIVYVLDVSGTDISQVIARTDIDAKRVREDIQRFFMIQTG